VSAPDPAADAAWMRRCLALADRARGRTAPNPMVGAVIVRDGELLGEGWTYPPPGAHGEIAALSRVADARGATMYVNLEPCCHWGRTPPCTDALIKAGVSRVVVGMVDPFPKVAGRGIAQLRDAGIEVEVGVEEAACQELNGGFVKALQRGLPRVWLKAAATLDGRIADSRGASKWITGEAAREEGRRWRTTRRSPRGWRGAPIPCPRCSTAVCAAPKTPASSRARAAR
jgi:diaminohydroxyphosphoribosylaminopyrimidine deaminase/5-amino-6-(5-phosphoribosylamino)uracil reductase